MHSAYPYVSVLSTIKSFNLHSHLKIISDGCEVRRCYIN